MHGDMLKTTILKFQKNRNFNGLLASLTVGRLRTPFCITETKFRSNLCRDIEISVILTMAAAVVLEF